MTRRSLAWSPALASGVLMALGIAAVITIKGESSMTGDLAILLALSFVVPIVAFTVIGGLIVSRRPGNVVGRLLAAIGLMFGLVIFCSSVAEWGLRTGSLPRPLAEWVIVPANAWVVALGLLGTQLLLRLPDGTLPSRRWRWYSRATIVLIAVSLVGMAAHRGRVMGVPGTANPLGAGWAEPLANAFLLVILCFVVSIAALIVRYRRSTGRARAQLRWVAFSGGAFVAIYIVTLILGSLLGESSAAGNANAAFSQAAFAVLPIGIGFAVLRHDLYAIDVVINRTLVYGALTALLAAVYLASVLLLQLALSAVTAGSGLAVAGSTLATAALVRPARARIQATVDRRFFRQKYDAAQTLQLFGARLRDEVDLDALTTALRAAVTETMQPSHLTLWVRAPDGAR